jgi:hypothetical protein
LIQFIKEEGGVIKMGFDALTSSELINKQSFGIVSRVRVEGRRQFAVASPPSFQTYCLGICDVDNGFVLVKVVF